LHALKREHIVKLGRRERKILLHDEGGMYLVKIVVVLTADSIIGAYGSNGALNQGNDRAALMECSLVRPLL